MSSEKTANEAEQTPVDSNAVQEMPHEDESSSPPTKAATTTITAAATAPVILDEATSQWEKNFSDLIAYHLQHGNYNVPSNDPAHRDLHTFVTTLQRQHRETSPALSLERIQRLKGIDFFEQSTTSTTQTPQTQTKPASTNQTQTKPSSSTETTKQPWVEESEMQRWERNISELLEYKRQHGHFEIPTTDKAHQRLYVFSKNLLRQFREQKLAQDRIERLRDIGFPLYETKVNNDFAAWNRHFPNLSKYHADHGHVRLIWSENKALYEWCQIQREKYKAKKLSVDHIQQLNSLGFDWNFKDRKTERWEEKFAELKEFYDKNGHCDVRQDDSQLGVWIKSQRKNFDHNQLSQDRIDRLTSIGFKFRIRQKRKQEIGDTSRFQTKPIKIKTLLNNASGEIKELVSQLTSASETAVSTFEQVQHSTAADKDQWNNYVQLFTALEQKVDELKNVVSRKKADLLENVEKQRKKRRTSTTKENNVSGSSRATSSSDNSVVV